VIQTHGRGFVLARRERGESDLFVELLLDDGSLCRAVAKSAARSSRRFTGGLSPFTLYRFVFGRSASTVSARLEEASVERALPGLLTDLRRTAAAGAASVIARDIGGDVAQDPLLFDRYAALLDELEQADAASAGAGLVRFAVEGFADAGHPIVLDACVRCGREAPDNALVQMSPDAGGVVCGACGGGPYTLRAADRRGLRAVLAGDDAAFAPSMLQWLAQFIEPHAHRGAEAVGNAAAHWNVVVAAGR